MTVRLSATVLALDEEHQLAECVRALSFCDEVLVVDGGSRDRSVEVARAAGARVFERPFDDFARQHEFARETAQGAWVFSVDADERPSIELAKAARAIADGDDPRAAYAMPFKNHFRGVWLRHGGFWPDRHVRLYKREACRYDLARPVHEKLLVEGAVGTLDAAMLHYTYGSLAHCLRKLDRYAERGARALYAQGRRATAFDVAVRPFWRLVRAYVLRGGFLDGAAGAAMAWTRGYEAYARYARLWELSRFPDAERDALGGR